MTPTAPLLDRMAIEVDLNHDWLYLLLLATYKSGLQRCTYMAEVEKAYAEAQAGYDDCTQALPDYLKSIWPDQYPLWPVSSAQESMKRVPWKIYSKHDILSP